MNWVYKYNQQINLNVIYCMCIVHCTSGEYIIGAQKYLIANFPYFELSILAFVIYKVITLKILW